MQMSEERAWQAETAVNTQIPGTVRRGMFKVRLNPGMVGQDGAGAGTGQTGLWKSA